MSVESSYGRLSDGRELRRAARLRVVVLSGGDSPEREISLQSGRAVAAALRKEGHRVAVVDPAERPPAEVRWADFDACFIALHGGAGEDGRVQQQLEALGVPYTGSGPAACRAAMSKSASKERFLLGGVPTPRYAIIHAAEPHAEIARRAAALRYPLVVKPDGQGSSIGVSMVDHPEQLPAALETCFRYDSFGLIERKVAGRELTVALIDREVLPILEIVPRRRFFDYEAKYADDETGYRFDHGLHDEVLRRIERAARRAAGALDTRGLVRVDIMLNDRQQPWVLEVNTVPGLTDHSLAPKAAAQAGMPMPQLCERLVREAIAARRWKRAG